MGCDYCRKDGKLSILALDLGRNTGWALKQSDGQIVSGVTHFNPGRFEGGGMTFLRFSNWLDEIKELQDKQNPIRAIYFEEVRRHIGTTAAQTYGGFMGQLTSWAERHKIPYQGVPVGTIKKHATGKGNANKTMMIEAMKDKGFTPEDDNEADALALLFCISKSTKD